MQKNYLKIIILATGQDNIKKTLNINKFINYYREIY